jgi:hypothetical protein
MQNSLCQGFDIMFQSFDLLLQFLVFIFKLFNPLVFLVERLHVVPHSWLIIVSIIPEKRLFY